MDKSILVFVSHSSGDKFEYIEPIVADLESAYINVWIDKKKIAPGENLRSSILNDGLDKADIVLIFFTKQSLESSWVDKEIKHVLREEGKKRSNFNLNKIISIFDSQEVYESISERYPELTDDLMHLMPNNYTAIQLAQLVSAIWSKYLSLQSGDLEAQKIILDKDRELFEKDKNIQGLNEQVKFLQSNQSKQEIDFERIYQSGKADVLIKQRNSILPATFFKKDLLAGDTSSIAFGFVENDGAGDLRATELGRGFLKWVILNKEG
ncbi:MAG: toll/interleukin-1 receptor domain-containing protein [Proteobacteria bacterium]|nr:toll/interleukin-1 receptor domain-containing protein [Bacteroidota bacterium]MBU2618445.1 toll/interleukin-1 receptor domain-containing protein [Pseudomonadota bacterium]